LRRCDIRDTRRGGTAFGIRHRGGEELLPQFFDCTRYFSVLRFVKAAFTGRCVALIAPRARRGKKKLIPRYKVRYPEIDGESSMPSPIERYNTRQPSFIMHRVHDCITYSPGRVIRREQDYLTRQNALSPSTYLDRLRKSLSSPAASNRCEIIAPLRAQIVPSRVDPRSLDPPNPSIFPNIRRSVM